MNTTSAPRRNHGRRVLLAIALLFFGTFILAGLLRLADIHPAVSKQKGELLQPPADLRDALFGPAPAAEVVIGYEATEPVGFAIFFQTFSTFVGRPGLYLEDLFVKPEWRGRGYGRALMAHLAGIALARGYGRMEWAVLDWNDLALAVYRRVGAVPLSDWTVQRLSGDALRRLAATAERGHKHQFLNRGLFMRRRPSWKVRRNAAWALAFSLVLMGVVVGSNLRTIITLSME